jgi:predicted NUDIX family NTP pyrophosphohydrolase
MYRMHDGDIQVLLAHPGGPFFAHRDEGAWTIPKGEMEPNEQAMDAAVREFTEETGAQATGPFIPLAPITQKSGKRVHAWAFQAEWDPATLESNTVLLEWPPRSGEYREYPEVDRAEFFTLPVAAHKINPAQRPLLEELERKLSAPPAR